MSNSPEQVLTRVFAAIDDHRFDDLRGLYSDDVKATTVAGRFSGVDDVVAAVRQVHEPVAVLQHLISGIIADIDGDDAALRANVVAVFGDERRQPAFEGASVWRGRLRRTDGGWRVAEFALELVWARGEYPVKALVP